MGNEKFECSLHRCDPVEVHFRHIRKKNNVLVNYVMTYPAILVKLKKSHNSDTKGKNYGIKYNYDMKSQHYDTRN